MGETPTLPGRAGVGLKTEHARIVIDERPDIGWFEVHAENYMGDGGPAHARLEAIRRDYPLSIHGVGLSIGSAGPLDHDHLDRLVRLVSRYQPETFSEHLAWSSHGGVFLNDLLPVPYDNETLERVVEHVDVVQETLGRRILLENPSTYVIFERSAMGETDFLAEVASRTGCGLLLDVNNAFVSAVNHGYAANDYLDTFPFEHVGEIHLAGHATDTDDQGAPLLIDTHDRPVAPAVWSLYGCVVDRLGPVPTLIEWDTDVPDWPVLLKEAHRAESVLRGSAGRARRDAAV